MIRFLQTDNRMVKALIVVVIGAASITMVLYLIPGLSGMGSSSPDTYAVVYPHWYSRIFSSGDDIKQARVEAARGKPVAAARSAVRQQSHDRADLRAAGGPATWCSSRCSSTGGSQARASTPPTTTCASTCSTGPTGEVLYPDGKFIGDEAYRQLIDDRLHESVTDFENQIKDEITIRRLEALITGGVTVSDQEVREAYRKQNIKIKFDYAVISADDLRKTINPSDSELEAFFKTNAARYAQAVPEERKITYFAFTASQVPGGVAAAQPAGHSAVLQRAPSDYSAPEQAKSRHILISVPAGADAKTDAAAKAKAEMVLKQLQAGGSWTELAKKYSDDPGSKDYRRRAGLCASGARWCRSSTMRSSRRRSATSRL